MVELSFEILGDPRGKERPRVFNGHGVTPDKTRNYEQRIKDITAPLWQALEVKPDFHAPFVCDIVAYFEIPKSYSKRKRAECLQPGGELVHHPGKPDGDNIQKIVLDGCQGVLFADDSALVDGRVRKLWCWPGQTPRVCVRVRWG